MSAPSTPNLKARAPNRALLVGVALALIALALGAQWWHTRSHARFGEALAQMAKPGDIHLLAARDCEGCAIARAWLRQHRVAFSECSIEDDARCAAEYRASVQAAASAPADGKHGEKPGELWLPLVRVRGELQHGFMPQRIYNRLRDQA